MLPVNTLEAKLTVTKPDLVPTNKRFGRGPEILEFVISIVVKPLPSCPKAEPNVRPLKFIFNFRVLVVGVSAKSGIVPVKEFEDKSRDAPPKDNLGIPPIRLTPFTVKVVRPVALLKSEGRVPEELLNLSLFKVSFVNLVKLAMDDGSCPLLYHFPLKA
jgi:hypothetical protein